ncbi:Holliday junction branch migration protein RuvA [Marinobacter sp. V034]|uniref:Holliday junction branch migration protein RuvA n=1 Tax=Marinobacter sp. V034 TaxID=3459610 RepID=UPI004044A82D
MIGQIRGRLIEKQPGHVVVDCNGLGYEIDIPYTTFFNLPDAGQETLLYTHFSVREDAQSLFGFSARLERDLFRLLIKVNGVGPKLALAILSALDTQQFVRCVDNRDVNALVKVPGVGKKTAERLLIEMGDRLGQLEGMPSIDGVAQSHVTTPGSVPPGHDPLDEAEAALIALGYKPQEAAKAVSRVAKDGMSSTEIIRLALKSMIPAG